MLRTEVAASLRGAGGARIVGYPVTITGTIGEISMFRAIALSTLLLLPMNAMAVEVPWQGRLTDANGEPLTGSYDLTVRLYPQVEDGTASWTGTFPSTQVADGFVALRLGSTEALDPSEFAGSGSLWVEIEVGSTVLEPRQEIGVVPRAATADRIRGGVTTLGLTRFENTTRTNTPPSANINDKEVVWTVQVDRESPTSSLRVEGQFPTFRSTQNACNNFVRINGHIERAGFGYNEGVDTSSLTAQQADVWFTPAELGTTTGSMTVEVGYYALANGNGWECNWFVWNPNVSDDPRLEQTVSTLSVTELEIE